MCEISGQKEYFGATCGADIVFIASDKTLSAGIPAVRVAGQDRQDAAGRQSAALWFEAARAMKSEM
jgi:hypothetical protein